MARHDPFPFSALVGQEAMRDALVLAAINPAIGGVLVMGDRGTGKSTIVRGLANLLPKRKVWADCPYGCLEDGDEGPCEHIGAVCAKTGKLPKTKTVAAPVVDLPLGVTEDRVVGALDIERALVAGEKRFEPGLLAAANGGFLYIDEVNLLEDHIVDLLLDVAASGENLVEREGISIRHPAKFVLIGSGNPEEGELRPQMLDRFGLSVDVRTPTDIKARVEIIKRREAYENDPAGFIKKWARRQSTLRRRIVTAQHMVNRVSVPDDVLLLMAELCTGLGTDGLRGELTLTRAAKAKAAFEGRAQVENSDIRSVAMMALSHRLRRDPLDDSSGSVRVSRAINDVFKEAA